MIPDLFPERQRTSALSLLMVGAPVGSFLGLLIGGSVATAWGWRAAFIVAGLPGLFVGLLMLLTMRDPRSVRADPGRHFEGHLLAALRDLVSRPSMWSLGVIMAASTFLIYASGAWLPAFFIRVHGMSTAEIGRYAALAVGVGGGLGTVASGFVCDRIRPRARHAESIVLLILFAASIPTLLVTVLAGSTALALGAMFLFNICAFAWLGPMTRLVQRAAGPAHHALAIAFCSAFATLFSLSCGLPLIGFLSDALTASAGARAIGYALAMTIPSAALLAILLHLRVLKTLRQSTNV